MIIISYHSIDKFFDILCKKLCLISGYFLLCIIALTTINAIAFILNIIIRPFGLTIAGFSGYEDFVYLLIAGCVLFFLPHCQLHQTHIRVDIINHFFSNKLRLYLDCLHLLLITFIYEFVAYWFYAGLVESYHDNILSSVLLWPIWPFYIPGFIALLLSGCIAFYQCLKRIFL